MREGWCISYFIANNVPKAVTYDLLIRHEAGPTSRGKNVYMYIFKVGLYLNLLERSVLILFLVYLIKIKTGLFENKKGPNWPTPLIFHTPFTCRHTGVNFCVFVSFLYIKRRLESQQTTEKILNVIWNFSRINFMWRNFYQIIYFNSNISSFQHL